MITNPTSKSLYFTVASAGNDPRCESVIDASTTAAAGPPSPSTTGFSVSDALACDVRIALREDPTRRTVYLVPTADAATTYTTTIDGNAVATTGDASLATVLADIADDINTDGTVGGIVLAEVVDADGDGVDDAVKLTTEQSKLNADPTDDTFTLAVSVSGGSGTLTAYADPETASLDIYSRHLTAVQPTTTLADDIFSGAMVLPVQAGAIAWGLEPGNTTSGFIKDIAITKYGGRIPLGVGGLREVYPLLHTVAAAGDTTTNVTYLARVYVFPTPIGGN